MFQDQSVTEVKQGDPNLDYLSRGAARSLYFPYEMIHIKNFA